MKNQFSVYREPFSTTPCRNFDLLVSLVINAVLAKWEVSSFDPKDVGLSPGRASMDFYYSKNLCAPHCV